MSDPAVEAAQRAWRVQTDSEPLGVDNYTIRVRTLAAREALAPIRELHKPRPNSVSAMCIPTRCAPAAPIGLVLLRVWCTTRLSWGVWLVTDQTARDVEGHVPELRERRHYDPAVIPADAWVCSRCEMLIAWANQPTEGRRKLMSAEPDEKRGLYGKYRVEKVNGKPVGECFVLEEHDPLALPALRAYAEAGRARYPFLADDLERMESRWRAKQAAEDNP